MYSHSGYQIAEQEYLRRIRQSEENNVGTFENGDNSPQSLPISNLPHDTSSATESASSSLDMSFDRENEVKREYKINNVDYNGNSVSTEKLDSQDRYQQIHPSALSEADRKAEEAAILKAILDDVQSYTDNTYNQITPMEEYNLSWIEKSPEKSVTREDEPLDFAGVKKAETDDKPTAINRQNPLYPPTSSMQPGSWPQPQPIPNTSSQQAQNQSTVESRPAKRPYIRREPIAPVESQGEPSAKVQRTAMNSANNTSIDDAHQHIDFIYDCWLRQQKIMEEYSTSTLNRSEALMLYQEKMQRLMPHAVSSNSARKQNPAQMMIPMVPFLPFNMMPNQQRMRMPINNQVYPGLHPFAGHPSVAMMQNAHLMQAMRAGQMNRSLGQNVPRDMMPNVIQNEHLAALMRISQREIIGDQNVPLNMMQNEQMMSTAKTPQNPTNNLSSSTTGSRNVNTDVMQNKQPMPIDQKRVYQSSNQMISNQNVHPNMVENQRPVQTMWHTNNQPNPFPNPAHASVQAAGAGMMQNQRMIPTMRSDQNQANSLPSSRQTYESWQLSNSRNLQSRVPGNDSFEQPLSLSTNNSYKEPNMQNVTSKQ